MSASACHVCEPSTAARTLRVGVIGLGVGMAHAQTISEFPHARLVRVCDLSAARCAEAASNFAGVERCARPDEVLAAGDLDVIVIASYDDCHAEQVLAALRADKHVFVEKPLCLRRDDAGLIRAALLDRPHLRMSSNLVLRASPRFAALRACIQRGELGDLFGLEGDYQYGRLHKLTSGWRGRTPGYSVTLGGAIHLIDLLEWLSSDRIVEVAAFGTNIASRGSRFAGADEITAAVRFAGGAVGRIGVSYGCVRPHFHGLTLRGTLATFVNDLPEARLYTSRDPTDPPLLICDAYPGVHKGALLMEFLRELSGAPPVGCGAVPEFDVFQSLAVAFAIDESVAGGGRVCAVRPIEPVAAATESGRARP